MLSFSWAYSATAKDTQVTYRVSFPQEIDSYWEDDNGRWVRLEDGEQYQVFESADRSIFRESSLLDEHSTEAVTFCYEEGCWAMVAEESRDRDFIESALGAQVRWPD